MAEVPERRVARRALQRVVARDGAAEEYLSFCLAGELYGVAITRVREIAIVPPLTQVPRARPEVLGLCSVRGLLVTVLDLRRRLGVAEGPTTRRSRVLLVGGPQEEVLGLFVDEVRQVVLLAPTELEPASVVLGAKTPDHVAAVGRLDGQLLVIIDLKLLLES